MVAILFAVQLSQLAEVVSAAYNTGVGELEAIGKPWF